MAKNGFQPREHQQLSASLSLSSAPEQSFSSWISSAHEILIEKDEIRDNEKQMHKQCDQNAHLEKRWLTPAEALDHVRNLNRANRSHSDERNPYRLNYQARAIIEQMLRFVDAQVEKQVNHEKQNDAAAWDLCAALLRYFEGINHLETEEWSTGEAKLRKALPILRTHTRHFCLELIDSYNQLAIVWSSRGKYKRAYSLLVESQRVHRSVKFERLEHQQRASAVSPSNSCQNTSNLVFELSNSKQVLRSEEGWQLMENMHTLTLFYLAQVMQQIDRPQYSAVYCQLTLSRQLQTPNFESVRLDWVRNTADLSAYYCAKRQLRDAHHCLTAAQHFLRDHFPLKDTDDPTRDMLLAADVAKAWGTFYLIWLRHSKELLTGERETESDEISDTSEQESKPQEAAMADDDDDVCVPLDEAEMKTFALEELETQPKKIGQSNSVHFDIVGLPESPACEPVKDFDEAKLLFSNGLDWFNQSMRIYKLDGYVSDNIPLQQSISQLFKLLADFDNDVSRKAKLHKRRIDLLEPVFHSLNPAYFLELYQQLANELALTYTELMELKLVQKGNATDKTNSLAMKAIHYHTLWLGTFDKEGKPPETIDRVYQRVYLSALFHIARLHGKIFSNDRNKMVFYIKRSLEHYEQVVQWTIKLKADDIFSDEFAISKELVQLLPFKIQRVIENGSFRE